MPVKPEDVEFKRIVIGTRGSPLALVQAHMARDELAKIGSNFEVEIRVIKTSGDWRPEDGEKRLEALAGGKAQFATEIEEALLAGEIDIAVHSMKDMECVLPEGLVIPYMLPREDVRDAFLSNNDRNIDDLPVGCTVGTVSVRRQAFLLHRRPDLRVVPFRGNVQTRIDKLRAGQVDATFLACAGLNRLGMADEITALMAVEDMLPAAAQGAVGIEMRAADMEKFAFMSRFSCEDTYLRATCERGVLQALGGSCHTPVGAYGVLEAGEMHLRAAVVSPDGAAIWAEDVRETICSREAAHDFGMRVGARLKAVVPTGVLS